MSIFSNFLNLRRNNNALKEVMIASILFTITASPCTRASDTIAGCYKEEFGQLRIVKGHDECLPSEVGVSLNGHEIASSEYNVNCNAGEKIQDAIEQANSHDVIFVSGSCEEHLLIAEDKNQLIIDGQGLATITWPNTDFSILHIRGGDFIHVKGFVIAGGQSGIHVSDNGSSIINGNQIRNAAGAGILIETNSMATIINNTIEDNLWVGIGIYGNASAYIGIEYDETNPGPNVIQNNGVDGIHVFGSSGAVIVGNSISNNGQQGVRIDKVSYGQISSNLINSNGLSGILVDGNSGVDLGSDAGLSIFNAPNMTTANNTNYGFYCEHNSYADGRIGTLDGDPGEKWFGAGCIDSLDNAPSLP